MITENFSENEKRRLKQRLSSYGAIGYCTAYTGIHRSTIARVLKTGAASKEVMDKLRSYLVNNSKLFIELQPEVLRPTG